VLPLCYKENPRIYLEKTQEDKKLQKYKMFKKSNLKCALPVLAHKNYYALFASSS